MKNLEDLHNGDRIEEKNYRLENYARFIKREKFNRIIISSSIG